MPRIEGIETPASVQPGERIRIDWRTTSDLPIIDTHIRWGTSPGSREVIGKSFANSGLPSSYTDTIHVMERSGAISVSVVAVNAQGAQVESPEVTIPVRWNADEMASVISATPAAATSGTRSFPLEVSTSGTIENIDVRIDFESSGQGDLTIDLLAPSGRVVRLLDARGTEKHAVLGTFGSDMVSAESLTALRGEGLPGRWSLQVADRGPAPGFLHMWGLVVTRRIETARRVLAPPNLVALPADDVSVIYVQGGRYLAFGGRVQNAGPGPVQFRGDVDHATGRTRAWQQVMNRLEDPASGQFLGWEVAHEVPVGDLVFEGHENHEHWHMAEVMTYTIQSERFEPVPGVEPVRKLTRCLTDSRRYDFLVTGSPAQRTYFCGQARQGISVGWEDNYGAGTDGQYLGIGALPDGVYYIVTELTDRFVESGSRVDNQAATKIRIAGNWVEILESLDGQGLAGRRNATR